MKKIFKLIHLVRLGLLPIFLKSKVAAATEHRALLASLDCNHVVDVGANHGQFALIARKVFPNAQIDSFEPLIEPAKRFQLVFGDDENTALHRVAIGSTEEEAIIHVSKSDDSSSLLSITEVQSSLFPGTDESETRVIKVVPLKDVMPEQSIQKPALLKIDVQGFELEVLQGGEELLNQFSYIYVECSFIELYAGQPFAKDIIEFLSVRDFALDGIYNLCYDRKGKAVQADFFFVNSNN